MEHARGGDACRGSCRLGTRCAAKAGGYTGPEAGIHDAALHLSLARRCTALRVIDMEVETVMYAYTDAEC